MRRIVFALGLVLVLVTLNGAVWHKEALLRGGRRICLRLAPVDPRSLMQGDYMRLRYELGGRMADADRATLSPRGRLVLVVAADGVARYERVHGGEALGPGERLIRYHMRGGQVTIGAESFFFQEGHARLYERARYGVLVVSEEGEALLVGLCDEKLRMLGPDSSP